MKISIIVIFCTFFPINQGVGQNTIDSLQTLLISSIAEDTTRVNSLNELSLEYFIAGDYNESILLSNKALVLSEKIDFSWGIQSSYFRIAVGYKFQNDYSKALEYYFLALKKMKELGETKNALIALMNIGNVYEDISDYSKALEYYMQALEMHQEIGNNVSVAGLLNNIALIYLNQNEYSKALEELLKVLKIEEELKNDEGISMVLNNIAICFSSQKKYSEALKYFLDALEIRERKGKPNQLFQSYNNIGDAYRSLKEYDLALNYFSKAKYLENLNQLKIETISFYQNFGDLYFELKEYENALLCYQNKSLKFSKEIGALRQERAAEKAISQTYEKLNDPIKGFEHYKLFNLLNDSIYSESKSREIIEMQTKYSVLEYEKQLSIKEEQSKRQHLYLIYLGSMAFFVLIVGALLLYVQRRNLKLTKVRHENTQLQKDKLESELTLKHRKLTAINLRVMQNNQFLFKLDELISRISGKSKETIGHSLQLLKKEIKQDRNVKKDQIEFQKQFEEIHKEFIEKLKTKHTSLTSGELRICVLMRINMSTLEIASFLGISPSSLKTSRYRIHKKMDLEHGIKLHDHLLMFE